jgi:hypothetical protein
MHSCCSCGARIKNDQKHCSVCGISILQNENSLFSCSGVGIGGELGKEKCILKLTSQRLLIITSVTGTEHVFSVNLGNVRKLDYKGSIIHANKGKYQLHIVTRSPKKQFKLVADEGKSFAKKLKKAKKAKRGNSIYHQPSNNNLQNHIPNANSSISNQKAKIEKDPSKMSILLGIFCFITPFLGVAIWFAEKAKYPKKARLAILLSIYPSLIIFIGPHMARTHENMVTTDQVIASPISEQDTGSNNPPTSTSQQEWWQGGTLHSATALEWQNATYRNKLATCGDFMCMMWQEGNLSSRLSNNIDGMSDLRFWADSLVICLDISMERLPDEEQNRILYANQTVSEMTSMILIMSNWLK